MTHYYTTYSRLVKLDEETGKVIWEFSGEEIDALVKAANDVVLYSVLNDNGNYVVHEHFVSVLVNALAARLPPEPQP